uniref:Putative secreted protein n=1 Tax=Ixodes ricinus TaxID=34613 RepID=A0A6B0UJ39_IXORI
MEAASHVAMVLLRGALVTPSRSTETKLLLLMLAVSAHSEFLETLREVLADSVRSILSTFKFGLTDLESTEFRRGLRTTGPKLDPLSCPSELLTPGGASHESLEPLSSPC